MNHPLCCSNEQPARLRAAREESGRALVGTRVADVRLDARVARGTLATVYRGTREEGRAVAVKVYRRDLPGWDLEGRFGRERRAQRMVEHPCVAGLLGAGTLDDGSPYLVSEWIEGVRLEDRLEGSPMAWDELRSIVASVGRGLGAIHAAGVVHRDIKPSNIVLPTAGEAAAVILDFGHALHLDQERLTQEGWILGSAAYMAPEQAAGASLDGRADLYALGVVLYRGLAGVLPFEASSPAEAMVRHQHEPVVPPRVRAPERDVPPAAEDLCLWLLSKDRDVRVPSARVLAVTLEAMHRRSASFDRAHGGAV